MKRLLTLLCAPILLSCLASNTYAASVTKLTTIIPSPYGEYEKIKANEIETKKIVYTTGSAIEGCDKVPATDDFSVHMTTSGELITCNQSKPKAIWLLDATKYTLYLNKQKGVSSISLGPVPVGIGHSLIPSYSLDFGPGTNLKKLALFNSVVSGTKYFTGFGISGLTGNLDIYANANMTTTPPAPPIMTLLSTAGSTAVNINGDVNVGKMGAADQRKIVMSGKKDSNAAKDFISPIQFKDDLMGDRPMRYAMGTRNDIDTAPFDISRFVLMGGFATSAPAFRILPNELNSDQFSVLLKRSFILDSNNNVAIGLLYDVNGQLIPPLEKLEVRGNLRVNGKIIAAQSFKLPTTAPAAADLEDGMMWME